MDDKKNKLVRQDSVHSDTGSSNSIAGVTETCAEIHTINCDKKAVKLAKDNSESQSYQSITEPTENKSEFRSFEQIDSFDDIETFNDITNENLLTKQYSDTSYSSISTKNIDSFSDNNGNTKAKLATQQSSTSYNSVIEDGPKIGNNINCEAIKPLTDLSKPQLDEFDCKLIVNKKPLTSQFRNYNGCKPTANFKTENSNPRCSTYGSIGEYEPNVATNVKLAPQLSETSYNSVVVDQQFSQPYSLNKTNGSTQITSQINNDSFDSIIDISLQSEQNSRNLGAQSSESVYYSLNDNTNRKNVEANAQSSESIFYSFDGNTDDEPYIVLNYRTKTSDSDTTFRLSAQSSNSIYYSLDGNIDDLKKTNIYEENNNGRCDLKSNYNSVSELNNQKIARKRYEPKYNTQISETSYRSLDNNEEISGVKYDTQISQTSYHSVLIDPTELDSFHSNSSNESFRSAEFKNLEHVEVDSVISKIKLRWYTNYLILCTMIFYTVDVGSDWILIVRYAAEGHWLFFMLTFLFVIIPSMFITFMAHHVMDKNLKMPICVACVFNLSPLVLYWKLVNIVQRYWSTSTLKYKRQEFQSYLKRNEEACAFRLLESNYEAIPQFILQMVIILSGYPFQINLTTGLQLLSVLTSSVGTLLTNYSAYRSSYPPKGQYVTTIGGILYMLAAGLPLVCRSMSTAAAFSVYPWFTALIIFLHAVCHGIYHYFTSPKKLRYKMTSFALATTSIMTPFARSEGERGAFGAIMLAEDWLMVFLWGSTVSGSAVPVALTVMGLDLFGRVLYSAHYRFQNVFITYLSEDTKITRKLRQIEEEL